VAFGLIISWQFVVPWLNGVRSRNWPTFAAVIDRVVVKKQDNTGPGKHTSYTTYVTFLTYVYHCPELQTGSYDRSFVSEEYAQAWANSLKGCSVMVRVDPRNPSRSVLLKEDIDAAATTPPSPTSSAKNS
jgi:hypothetical protein